MKKNILFVSLAAYYLLLASKAYAVCPVCTIAVGVGVGISRKYGVDDIIAGLWVGALMVSMILWTIDYFNRKKIKFWGRNLFTTIAYYAIVLIPLYQKNIISQKFIGEHYQTLWGIDRLLLGIMIGSVAFLLGATLYKILKAKNNGHAHFPFEKVVMPITPIVILSIIFYFITKI